MRKQIWGVAVLAAAFGAPAGAVHTENYKVPYFGLGYRHLVTDSAREAGDGQGFQLSFGVPMSGASAIELRFFDVGIKDRFPDGLKDYQTGLMVDYVRDFGPVFGSAGDDGLTGLKPFVLAGIGFIQEDVLADKHMHLGANLGAGVIVPIGWKGWAVRLDARAQAQSNNESVPDQSVLVDYAVNLGLQIPMTLFFDRAVPAAEAECPVAVVDPATGRRDCASDSDNDGVDDTADECPGTPAGTEVDGKGCRTTAAQ